MTVELLNQIEFLLGSVGVILAFFFGTLLCITRMEQPKANLFLAIYLLTFALRIGKSLFHANMEIPAAIRTYLLATLYTIGPSIWLYTKYLSNTNIPFHRKDWLHYIPFVVIFILSTWITNDGTSVVFIWFYNGTILSMFIYTVYALWRTFSNRLLVKSDKDKIIHRWLRFFLIANLLLVVIYFLISTVFYALYTGISISFSLLIVFSAIRALRNPKLFLVHKERYSTSNLSDSAASDLANRLEIVMNTERPFLDPEMSLVKLSKLLDVSSKEMSQAINQAFDMNYAQYIAQHRISESQKRLAASDHQHLSIAAIAYDSGFNSISSFNAQFKKQVGITAKSFREGKLPKK